jgi:hypothetical protein
VVCLLTGHGFKYHPDGGEREPEAVSDATELTRMIGRDIEERN